MVLLFQTFQLPASSHAAEKEPASQPCHGCTQRVGPEVLCMSGDRCRARTVANGHQKLHLRNHPAIPVECLSGRVPIRSSACSVEYLPSRIFPTADILGPAAALRARRTAIIKIEFAFVHFLLIGCNSLFSLCVDVLVCWESLGS